MISASDIEVSAQGVWSSAGLDSQVPGSLHPGRLVSPATEPYAVLEVKPGKVQHYTEGEGPGTPYLAFFNVTVSLYGSGNKTVGDLLKSLDLALGAESWAIPGYTLFHVYLNDNFPSLEEDPTRKQGEDKWIGKLGYEVAFSGVR